MTGRGLQYRAVLAFLRPLNALLALVMRRRYRPESVLHISEMVHIAYDTTRVLREAGVHAEFMAVGRSTHWDRADHVIESKASPIAIAWQEFRLLWTVVARFEFVHMHFMHGLSRSGWELPLLKRMGRKLVVHYRGCEIRDRVRNMALHPDVNICQNCDYNATICTDAATLARREVVRRFGDAFIVTTPDMRDFVPEAVHLPFFAPALEASPPAHAGNAFRIVHVTNHPGIEGTAEIRDSIDRLRAKGFEIEFEPLHGATHEQAIAYMRGADLAIGKMKMGYYANAQIESLALGIPTVTFVRPEFVTPEIERSGLILARVDTLEETLEHYLRDPGALAAKREVARSSALEMHGRDRITRRMMEIYRSLQ